MFLVIVLVDLTACKLLIQDIAGFIGTTRQRRAAEACPSDNQNHCSDDQAQLGEAVRWAFRSWWRTATASIYAAQDGASLGYVFRPAGGF